MAGEMVPKRFFLVNGIHHVSALLRLIGLKAVPSGGSRRVFWPSLKPRKLFHKIPRQRPDPFENAGSELFGGLITSGEHLHFGIQIIEVMQGESLRGFGVNWRTELFFTMMGGDEMQEMQPDFI